MKRLTMSLLLIVSANAESLKEAMVATTVDGYLRATYQSHDVKNDKRYEDDALGAKLHVKTGRVSGIALGATLYSSNAIFNDDNKGLVPLRGETHKSYTILGEAYVQANFGKSMLKIGRQEIETPFAQSDDIGMIPNTFESAVLVSNEITNTTLFLGQIQKMAGVDAENIEKFTSINGSHNMQTVGLSYEGIDKATLLAWYYHLKGAEIDSIAYVEGGYDFTTDGLVFGLGMQYAKERYRVGDSANVVGVRASCLVEEQGLTFSTAYNKSKGNVANSGFGGGPFFSNSEYLIIDNVGQNATALWYGVALDASSFGVEGLNFGLGKITLKNEQNEKATEVDLVASYAFNNKVEFHMIYSDLKGANVGEDEAKHLRMFANYNF